MSLHIGASALVLDEEGPQRRPSWVDKDTFKRQRSSLWGVPPVSSSGETPKYHSFPRISPRCAVFPEHAFLVSFVGGTHVFLSLFFPDCHHIDLCKTRGIGLTGITAEPIKFKGGYETKLL